MISNYARKILGGELPNHGEWSEHLKEAHKIAPGMTPQAFAHYKTKQGKNSYQYLADSVSTYPDEPAQIVDLACGDKLISLGQANLESNGRISFQYPMRIFTVQKK